MVTACRGSRCLAATPAMVAAMPAWLVSSEIACTPAPAWQPGAAAGGLTGRDLCTIR